MKTRAIISAVLLTSVVAASGLMYLTHVNPFENARAAASTLPAVPIVAATVVQHDVPIYLSGVGSVIAYNTDVVCARIRGQIVSIN
jgi:multidrug efflux system membrane fusion protein